MKSDPTAEDVVANASIIIGGFNDIFPRLKLLYQRALGNTRRLTVIESPLRGYGDVDEYARNRQYLSACIKDSLSRGEAPIASHQMYEKVLDDTVATERDLGIDCGLQWAVLADLRAFYVDRGLSDGMRLGLQQARDIGQDVTFRRLGGEWTSVSNPVE